MQTLVNILIIWLYTTVSVPLYDSLDPYKIIPEAQLYIDGNLVYDEKMYYEYEINHTFFSVVNTSRVKRYRVDYRVYFPSYTYITSEQTIYFDVVDITPPTILTSEDIYIPVGQKNYDLLSGLTYKDDYDNLDEIRVEVLQESSIDYTKVAVYPIIYKVTDNSGNSSYQQQNVYVYDHIKPTIEQKEMVIINPNEFVDIYKYFTIKDNYDKVLTISLIDGDVIYDKIGTYRALLVVKDQSENQIEADFEILIKDMIAPKIQLKETKVNWDLAKPLSNSNLLDYVSQVYDNYDLLTIFDINIIHLIDVFSVGSYDVLYQINDSSKNEFETKLIVNVGDYSKPIIDGPDIIILEVLDPEVHLIDYFTIYDEHCLYQYLDIKFVGKVNMNQTGDYRIDLIVNDLNKNDAVKQFKVLVLDTKEPQITQNQIIEIYDFKKRNLLDYFTIKDNYSKDLVVVIDDSQVDYSRVGEYQFMIYATDSSNNKTAYNAVVNIIDQTIPQVILTTNQVYLEVNSSPLNLSDYIKQVYDGYDKDLTISDVIITSDIDYYTVGRYTVTYYIEDNQGLFSSEELIILIKDNTAPSLIVIKDLTLKQNEPFIFTNYISAIDEYDGDITHLIELSNPISTSNPGIYELIFTVSDSSGNLSYIKLLVTINKNSTNDIGLYLIGGGVIISTIAIILYFNKKQKMSSF